MFVSVVVCTLRVLGGSLLSLVAGRRHEAAVCVTKGLERDADGLAVGLHENDFAVLQFDEFGLDTETSRLVRPLAGERFVGTESKKVNDQQ